MDVSLFDMLKNTSIFPYQLNEFIYWSFSLDNKTFRLRAKVLVDTFQSFNS